ncbi:MAG: pantoate--beta-alanine ligase [bacterium]|nr:pantoate--beta-alanine ligase [bacterium]
MIVVKKTDEMKKKVLAWKKKGKTIGFVPTMGFLHKGHISLIKKARRENDIVAVSIFVNPIQFLPGEDFASYPRDFENDEKVCEREKIDVIFSPAATGIYPEGFSTFVEEKELSLPLCGRNRPGHFRGVTTVVLKLFNIIRPDTAYFGQKDAQQSLVIKKMVKDLDIPVKVKIVPTVRERDGLAMSSRNKYLSGEEREKAPAIYKSLKMAGEMVLKGERNAFKIKKRVEKTINSATGGEIDYIEIVCPVSLEALKRIESGALIAVAVKIGNARLIDNIIVKTPGKGIRKGKS